jgi:hypothetical protein
VRETRVSRDSTSLYGQRARRGSLSLAFSLIQLDTLHERSSHTGASGSEANAMQRLGSCQSPSRLVCQIGRKSRASGENT